MKKTKRGISCVLVLAVCLSLILQRAGAVSASEVRTDEHDGEKAKHSVTLEEAPGGELGFDGMQERTQSFEENAQVLLWATPNEMFTLKSIGIFDGQTGEELFSPEQTEEGVYTFPMPDRSVTVRGTFVQITEEKESEAAEDGTGTEKQYQADRDTYRQVDEDGYADHLHYFLV